MNCVETIAPATEIQKVIRLPLGLFGFEGIVDYVLIERSEEAPFLWLGRMDDPTLAFLVVPPASVLPVYQPDLNAEDVEFLGLDSSDDALILNIVTIREDGTATVNLKGPIVVNRHTKVAKQVVPINATDYSVSYPLPVAR